MTLGHTMTLLIIHRQFWQIKLAIQRYEDQTFSATTVQDGIVTGYILYKNGIVSLVYQSGYLPLNLNKSIIVNMTYEPHGLFVRS